MLLRELSEDQKDAFLALAAGIALPDDVTRLPLWQEWLAEMGLPPLTYIGWNDPGFAAKAFIEPAERQVVMLELARLGWHAPDPPTLLNVLRSVGELLGCSHDEVTMVDAWARKLAALKAEAAAMIWAPRCAA